MANLIRPVMADRGQRMAAAWTPRARLALTVLHAGRWEVEDTLLPLHSPAHALPPPSSQRSVRRDSTTSTINAEHMPSPISLAPQNRHLQLPHSSAVASFSSSIMPLSR